jgi:hypothetical protein
MKAATDSLIERCLVFNPAGNDNATLLAHEGCTDDKKLPYICEPTCKAASCPTTCTKNVLCFEFKVLRFIKQFILLEFSFEC